MNDNQTKNLFILGCIQVALANSFVGLNIILTKNLVNFASMSVLLGLRYFFAVLILICISLISPKKFQFYLSAEKFTNREKWIYIAMALSGGAIFNAIYTYGLKNTTAIATGMIGATIPLLIVLFSFLFLKQKIQSNHIYSAIMVSLGIVVLTIATPSNTALSSSMILSNFIVFMAMIPEAMFTILAKLISKPISPMGSALVINLINFLFCIPFFVFSIPKDFFYEVTPIFILFAFLTGLCIALFYSFYNAGISKINAHTAGLLTGVVPISTTIFSIIFLHEYFGVFSLIGLFCVLFSIYVGVKATSQKVLQ